MPNRDQRRRDGTFEYAQLDIAPASDEPALIACTCTPCVTPGNGGPTPGHCAACCGLTGIEEYDPACPVVDHREMALRQFGAAIDEPARCDFVFSDEPACRCALPANHPPNQHACQHDMEIPR